MIIGTAGHIDHGKSALVQALTGRSMDPLAEEQRRGITLDLHFAPLNLSEGRVTGVIDVPGHEDLIRTMVAGAAGLDLVLLIVAADEGIMPQTREHLAIIEQLRISAGIPVITKSDLVEPEMLALVETEVAEWLAHSPVKFSAPVATSAVQGSGLAQLRSLIESTSHGAGRRDQEDLFRLPIDRSMSFPGIGTVVTGTAWSGRLKIGDLVTVLPSGLEGRVRSLERHGQEVSRTEPGERIAVGLAGLDRQQVRRGDVLVRRDERWISATAIDGSIELLPSAPRALAHHARVRIDLATDEVMARVHCSTPIEPGKAGLVRLALERPLVARGGDRFVLRSYSPVETIGGGWVIDPAPGNGKAIWPKGISSSSPALRLAGLVSRRAKGLDVKLLPVILGVSPRQVAAVIAESGVVRAGEFLVAAPAVAQAREAARRLVAEYHHSHPRQPGMPLETLRQTLQRHGPAGEAALDELTRSGDLVLEGGQVRARSHQAQTSGESRLTEQLISVLEESGLTPPSVGELEKSLKANGVLEALKTGARSGRIEAVERERYFSVKALDGFREVLHRLGSTGAITPQALRDETGLSRKFLIPLLEWSDRIGLTLRSGDSRVLAKRRTTPVGGA